MQSYISVVIEAKYQIMLTQDYANWSTPKDSFIMRTLTIDSLEFRGPNSCY